ncbi:MAG: 4-alpha-glucanotransferase [Candidatus Omnitrophota bacterium]
MQRPTLKDQLINTSYRDKWLRIGIKQRAGVLVPLFCVYSKKSLGIGDLEDLKLLADWCAKTANSIIQLLPMNEMGPLFCPYDSVSSFALEPSYLCLDKILCANRNYVIDGIERIRKTYPLGRAHVDYGIKQEKMRLLWEVFLKEDSAGLAPFDKFKKDNAYWLEDFSLFQVIRHYQGGRPWYEWQEDYKDRKPSVLDAFYKEHEKEIMFQVWMQWQLYLQFKGAREYVNSKGVLLKGDLPLLVSRDSADVWAHPEFFKLEYSAGAPPDMYCAKGQRWGMPTYNWQAIARDGYRYLREKLKYAQNYYDILRIDHVVGLLRIWSIPYTEPQENQGLNGFFDPPQEDRWRPQAQAILSVMQEATDMLLCAEDLGVIPKACTQILLEMGIPGNDVQRWVKDWQVRHDFLEPGEYRFLSVAMLSTHDTTNWAAWWENEAGTVDEGLFMRRCLERGIDYFRVKDKLFNPLLSYHGRLRWQDTVNSVEVLIGALGTREEEIKDFIDMYKNSYKEKEKLWVRLGMPGPMQEKASKELIGLALKFTLSSRAVFCIQLITDWLSLADVFKADPYALRINTPGTVDKHNWSLVMPIALEDLLRHKVCKEVHKMVVNSGRGVVSLLGMLKF